MRVKNAFSKATRASVPQNSDALDRILLNVTQSDDETIVDVQGEIGDGWGASVSAKEFIANLRTIDTPIRMRINTFGGALYDATDIYHGLVDHPHKVNADIVGACWSAGTVICAAADHIRIGPTSVFGIHRARSGFLALAFGNHEELGDFETEMADVLPPLRHHLKETDAGIAQIMADRSGNSVAKIHDWMAGKGHADGTEWVGKAAVDAGFVDEMMPTKKASKEADNKQKHLARMAAFRKRQVQILRLRASTSQV